VTVPPFDPCVIAVTLSVSPLSGAKLSLARTLTAVALLSSATVAASGAAVGSSLALVTVIVTVPIAVPPLPSLSV
jgi:hypothetical protein